jgi:hypothetical protein
MPTPTSNHAALALLRADPDSALAKYGFLVDSEVYLTGAYGGPCLLSCSDVGGGMFKLTAKAGSGDFLFPYVNGVPGVGECMVPGAQSDGCIVTTGGMNGCSLQVNRVGNVLMFYHDNNGTSIAGLATPPPGNMVARADYKDYAGALDLGRTLADSARSLTATVMTTAQYQYYCLTVRHAGRWKVYYSSVLQKGISTKKYLLFGGSEWTKTEEFSSFKPNITPLITSFDA